ncbi:MAG: hypothetical protein JRI46_10970 [Deltaproteobacteria bacterium]|nr:hypothetical protein [Deltaproteobacteria bacterium]
MTRLKLIIPCLLAFVLIFSLIGLAQEKVVITKLYKMEGNLRAIDLTEGWALIKGLRWDLAEDFKTEDFYFGGKTRVEFSRPIRVIFFVRCAEVTDQDVNMGQSKRVKKITRLDLIKELNERGARSIT